MNGTGLTRAIFNSIRNSVYNDLNWIIIYYPFYMFVVICHLLYYLPQHADTENTIKKNEKLKVDF